MVEKLQISMYINCRFIITVNPYSSSSPCSRPRDIHRGKFKSRSPKLSHVHFDLVFCMPSKLLLVVDTHTPNLKSLALAVPEISGSVYLQCGLCPPSWIRPLVGFHNSTAFRGAIKHHLVKFERNLITYG